MLSITEKRYFQKLITFQEIEIELYQKKRYLTSDKSHALL